MSFRPRVQPQAVITLTSLMFCAAVCWSTFCRPAQLAAQSPSQSEESRTMVEILPTGMSITPLAAPGSTLQPLNPGLADLPEFTADHPVSTALSPDGNTLLILTTGYNTNQDARGKAIPALSNEYVFIYDVRQQPPVQRQVLQVPNTFVGVAWNPSGRQFYVSGGLDECVHAFEYTGDRWAEQTPPIALHHAAGLGVKAKPVAAGLAVNRSGTRLLVANFENDSVSLVNLETKQVIAELDLRPGKNNPAQKGVPGGEYPYWVAFKGDKRAYVSSLRDREIVVLDLNAAPAIAGRIKVHGQPNKMIMNRAQTRLFVAADNSDSVVVVDTTSDRVVATIKSTAPPAIFPNRAGFKGSNPNSVALSPDERTLYVTNGGTNSVAVVHLAADIRSSGVVGLIPTGWYPNSVSVSQDGKYLYVVNGKSNPGPNPGACRNDMTTDPDTKRCATAQQYVWQLEKGGFSVIPTPGAAELVRLTAQATENNHYFTEPVTESALPLFAFLHQRIKHIIYVVKENRSYDQVLGDLETGNGDPSLTLFPEALSPNHHQLARQFVTLDNFYATGEVSGNGWLWSTAARATDFLEKAVPPVSAHREIPYDFEGMNRGVNPGGTTADSRNTSGLPDPDDLLPGSADVNAPDGPEDEAGAGYLWDSALRAKLRIRNYGFFVDLSKYNKTDPNGAPLLHDPAASRTPVAYPLNPRLIKLTDPYFRGFDQRFSDYWRLQEWAREFDGYVKNNNLPSLELVRLGADHFGDFDKAVDGVNTVEAQMGDNDYALGLLVEKVAHSKYAADTLIFVLEDDAQNGPDHVDAHRSPAFVIGPYVKQQALVPSRFNTVSMLRTIEMILGMRPLGINDALEQPMWQVFSDDIFSKKPAAWSYTAKVPQALRRTQLPLPPPGAADATGETAIPHSRSADYWSAETQEFDFSQEDKVDSARFNMILWEGLKPGQPYPRKRDGRDLRGNRKQLLEDFSSQKLNQPAR
ncbi:MAG TPA: beta-propeller fold lactonase family protein [Alphaproteobacteria bacterium]|nr:beta-propeller fold lactonase family protein [Alphaproteobacteria bacterium]